VNDSRRRIVFAGMAIVPAALLALYTTRSCPDLALLGDSAELVTAAALWGVPHPPGYPLFTAIGHAFAFIPVGTIPWRVHMTSAVFHAAAVLATMAAALELTELPVAAVGAGVALGLSRSFVFGSLYAEVFPLNDFLCAATLALALRAHRAPGRSAGRALQALALTAGVAAGHHMMFALLVPALAALAFRPAATFVRESPRRAIGLAGAFLAPLVLAYALVPLAAARGTYLSWGDIHDGSSLLRVLTRSDYGGLLSPARNVSGERPETRVVAWAHLLVTSAGWFVVGGGLLGLADRIGKERSVGIGLLLAVAVPGPVFAWLDALDTSTEGTLQYFERFTTMSHVGVALAFGAGVGAARSALGDRRQAARAFAAALLVWMGSRYVLTRDVDLGTDRTGIAYAHDLLLRTPERSLILLSGDQRIDAELYVCGVERLCGDRIAFAPGTLSLPWKMAQVRRRHPDLDIPWASGPALKRTHLLVAAARDRPVYLSPELLLKDPLLSSFETTQEGLLLRVGPPRAGSPDASEGHGGGRSMSW
jgi:hypothetical protein